MSIEFAPQVKEGRVIYVLIPLLILHLALLSLQIEDPAGTTFFKKWVLLASAPFLDISSTLSGAVRRAWGNYIWLHGAREENLLLREALKQGALREKALSLAQEENIRLRQLLDLRERLPFQGIAAHVIGRVPAYLSNMAFVDQGSESGIRVDAPVLSTPGVIGHVVLVSRHHSQVQLITNPDASMGVMVERTRSPGVLRGLGNQLLDLNYIGNTEQVNVGDIVVSSGLDGIFPKGLPVGKVVESRKGKSVFRVIQVEPYADLLRIDDVLILLGTPGGK